MRADNWAARTADKYIQRNGQTPRKTGSPAQVNPLDAADAIAMWRANEEIVRKALKRSGDNAAILAFQRISTSMRRAMKVAEDRN